MSLYPDDVSVDEYGDRAQLVGIRECSVPSPIGGIVVYYVLYRIALEGGKSKPHAQFEKWSYDHCTFEELDWLRTHMTQFRQTLEDELRQLD